MAIYVRSVMYCLRLFIIVLQELYCLQNCLHVCMIRVYHITKFCYSGFCNTLPEAVYCCSTRTTLFSELFGLEVTITSPSFITLHPLVAKCIT